MNKLTIPAILVATVMVAGIFAFMPVQQASTVHTSGTITIANDAITAAKIADNSITADQIGTDAIGALELADAVEPLSNVLTVSSADLNAAGLDASCGAGGDAFLVHWVATGASTDVLEIDLTDNAGAELSILFTAGETLISSGTVAGAAGATVEIAGNDDASVIAAIVTVQCTGNGTPAIIVD